MKHAQRCKPRLLVSVRDANEAVDALAGGADWIDLKEPLAGPLGAVSALVARGAVDAVDGRRPVSAALGELRDWPEAPSELLAVGGLGVVKLGLAGCAAMAGWRDRWRAVARQTAAAGKQLVTVAYADWRQVAAPSPESLLDLATNMAEAEGSRYLLIDTFDKQAGSTLDCLSPAELADTLQKARDAAMTTVLAGSVDRASLGRLPLELVDVVAVRGAVCAGDRTGRVDASLVRLFREALATRSVPDVPAVLANGGFSSA